MDAQIIEVISTIVSAAGVVVALALGAYGVCRDRKADEAVLRSQAGLVVLTEEHLSYGRMLTLHNASAAPIVDTTIWHVTISSREEDAGEEVETYSRQAYIDAGSKASVEIDDAEAALSDELYWAQFTDANGKCWTRFSNGRLVGGSVGRQ